MIVLLILFDYVIPFTAFGLSGLFYDRFEKITNVIKAIILVSVIRLISSTLSGVILWQSSILYAQSEVEAGNADPNLATRIFSAMGENLWLYSFGYNFIYIFTTGVVVTLITLVSFKRLKDIQTQFNPL